MLPRWVWRAGPSLVFGVAFFVLSRFVRRGPPVAREISVDRTVSAWAPPSLIDLSHAVDVQRWLLVVAALVVCLLVARRFRQALLLALAEPLADGLNLALKIVINRQLPDQGPVLGWDRLDVLLFPSGHVVRTTVTLGLLVLFVAWPHARWRWVAAGAALSLVGLVAVTQVAVGGHLPLDVLGGFLLGGALVNLVWVVDRAWAERSPGAGARQPRTGVVVTEVRPAARPAVRQRALAEPDDYAATRRRRARVLQVAGLAAVLTVAALGVRAPQRVWHVASQPTSSATWARAVVVAASQHAQPARSLLSRVHDWLSPA